MIDTSIHLRDALQRFLTGRFRRWLLVALLVILALRVAQVMVRYPLPLGYDSWAYLGGARALVEGVNPVGQDVTRWLPEVQQPVPAYVYPPVLALLLAPLSLLSFGAAQAIWLSIVLASTLALVLLLHRFVGWTIAVIGVCGFVPVWESLWLGQINAIVACCLALALLMLRRERYSASGLWLGMGALLKVTPGLGVLVLALRGYWRSVLSAALIAVGTLVLTLPFLDPLAWITGMARVLTLPVDHPALISWPARLERWFGAPGGWLGLMVTIGGVVLLMIRARKVDVLLAVAASILLPMLIARITWNHHAVMALPALAVLWRQRSGRPAAAVAWLLITLVSGMATLVSLTACFLVCCFPDWRIIDRAAPPDTAVPHEPPSARL